MAAPKRVVQSPREEVVEIERESPLEVYGDVLSLIGDIYQAVLSLENSESVAALLKGVEQVKVKVEENIEGIKEEMEMQRLAAEYEREENG